MPVTRSPDLKCRRPRSAAGMERACAELVDHLVEAGEVVRTDWRDAGYRPLLRTPLPYGADVELRPDLVLRVLTAFRSLPQLVGRWAGQPFELFDWQAEYLIVPVFGIVYRSTGHRVIRTVWDEVPRKNGKSTTASGLGLYLFAGDGESGAQVYAAAGDRSQAGIVFGPCRDMAAGSRPLAKRLGSGIRRHYLEDRRTGSVLRALSSDGARQHGLNIHGAIIDEVHVHKTPDLIDALETGTGSREQPLVVFITTADDGDDGSIYAVKREYAEGVAAGHIVDRSFYAVIFAADDTAEGFDPFAAETLRSANPGAGLTVSMEYLLGKADEARQSPPQLNRYLRLHLNVRTKQTTRWLPLDRWDASAGALDPVAAFADRASWGGLDLSSTTDLTAFAFVAPIPAEDRPELVDDDEILAELDDEAGDGRTALVASARGYYAHVLHWLPEERLGELERRTGVPLSHWVELGWLRTTEGNVVDYAQVRADIIDEAARLGTDLAEIAYDPWNATETVQELSNAGLKMIPLRQGYASLSAPCKELERLVMGSTPEAPLFVHGGNPVLRWQADAVEVLTDPGGNIKPTKPDRRKSAKRIDGIAACVNALARAMLRPPPKKRGRVVGF